MHKDIKFHYVALHSEIFGQFIVYLITGQPVKFVTLVNFALILTLKLYYQDLSQHNYTNHGQLGPLPTRPHSDANSTPPEAYSHICY